MLIDYSAHLCDRYEMIKEFARTVKAKSEFQANKIDLYLNGMSALDYEELNKRLEYLHNAVHMTMEEIATRYIAWCLCFVDERKFFVRSGEYRFHTYAEIDHIYKDEEYMKNYMVGLSISAYLWNIQRTNLDFFRSYCSKDDHVNGRYLEVGPGHGEYLIAAVNSTRFDEYIAYDISQSAVDQTLDYVEYYYAHNKAILEKIDIRCGDFFTIEQSEKYDAIVISQVIEHTENPRKFLDKTREIAAPDSLIYVSTAINSPLPDHIWHFRDRNEVVSMIEDSGFNIVDEFMATADGVSIDRAMRKKYDIEIGFVLEIGGNVS